MPFTLAMYEASHDHIRDRLEALGLDYRLALVGADGQFTVDGAKVAPADLDVDYFWFSSHIHQAGGLADALDLVLATRSVGVLQTFNAGLDNPKYAEISAKGARILNSSAQGVAISEYVIGQTMAVLQPIEEQRRMQASKTWRVTRFREISRTHWLIVGYGPIGSGIAKRIKAFEAKVSVARRSGAAAEFADRVGKLDDAKAFAADADVIVLACPLNDDTRGLIDADFLAGVKPGAILVNIARGGVIDDPALMAALDAGTLETAILDVFHTEPLPEADPLWTHPKVRLTPHTSFAGDGGQGRWDALFLEGVQCYAKGEPLPREVDPADIT